MIDLKTSRNFSHFSHKKIMAIDYGEKKIGTAYFTPGKIPFPLMGEVLLNSPHIITEINTLFTRENCDLLVVGIPVRSDGGKSHITEKIESFLHLLLKSNFKAPIYLQDETLSTYEAHSRMQNQFQKSSKKKRKDQGVDALAATIIIESFLQNEDLTLFKLTDQL